MATLYLTLNIMIQDFDKRVKEFDTKFHKLTEEVGKISSTIFTENRPLIEAHANPLMNNNIEIIIKFRNKLL